MTRRKDGRWLKVVTINKKKVYFYSSADTEKKAEKDIQRQLLEYQRKQDVSTTTLREIAQEWKERHFESISHKTQAEYTAMLGRIIDAFGDRRVDSIRPLEVENFIVSFAGKGYAKNTVSSQLMVFKMIMRAAVVQGIIDISPCESIKIPKNLTKKARDLPADETIQKIKSSIDCHFGMFAYLLLYTGLRRGEALALTYEDIDFENGTITVNKVITYESNQPIVRNYTKTTAGMRTVVLLDVLAEKLPKNKKGPVFFNGEYMTQQAYKRHFDRYKKESGVQCTAHQIRHAYATILYEAGISDKDTQSLMGHSDISLTRNIYQHIRQKKLADARAKLNQYVLNENRIEKD